MIGLGMLAEAAPSAQNTWVVMLCACGALGGVGSFGAMLLMRRPVKNEVSFDFVPASKQEFDKHTDWDLEEHRALHAHIGLVERAAAQRGETLAAQFRSALEEHFSVLTRRQDAGSEKLHERLNALIAAVGRLEGRLEH